MWNSLEADRVNGVLKGRKKSLGLKRVTPLRHRSSIGTFSMRFLHGSASGGCGTTKVGCTNRVSKGERRASVLQATFIGRGQALIVLTLLFGRMACVRSSYWVDGWDVCARNFTSRFDQKALSGLRKIIFCWLKWVGG